MFAPRYVLIHHSLTPDSQTVSWGAIRKYHIEQQKWSGVGYHWGVELVNEYYEILVGRTMEEIGAHCKEAEMNQKSIGVCVVGNFDIITPPEAQMVTLVRLVKWIQDIFTIPTERVLGHREAGLMSGYDWTKGQYKSCPGTQFSMEDLRRRLGGKNGTKPLQRT